LNHNGLVKTTAGVCSRWRNTPPAAITQKCTLQMAKTLLVLDLDPKPRKNAHLFLPQVAGTQSKVLSSILGFEESYI